VWTEVDERVEEAEEKRVNGVESRQQEVEEPGERRIYRIKAEAKEGQSKGDANEGQIRSRGGKKEQVKVKAAT
jgi:hypothetical protein